MRYILRYLPVSSPKCVNILGISISGFKEVRRPEKW